MILSNSKFISCNALANLSNLNTVTTTPAIQSSLSNHQTQCKLVYVVALVLLRQLTQLAHTLTSRPQSFVIFIHVCWAVIG